MKKEFNHILIATASLIVLGGCTKDYSGTEPYDPSSPSTKFVSFRISGASESDISVFDTKGNLSNLSADKSKGDNIYSGTVTESPNYHFLQPFSQSYTMNDETVEVTVPNIQKPGKNGMDGNAFFLGGNTSGYSCEMNKFSRKVTFGLDIDSELYGITLRTESGMPLAGKRIVYFDSEEPFAGNFTAGKKFSLFMEKPSNGELSLILPFGDISKGVSLEFVRLSDDRTALLEFKDNLTESESEDVNLGKISSSDLSWQKLIPLRFVESSQSDEIEWPFAESAEAGASVELTTNRGNYKITVDNFKGCQAESLKGFVFGSAEGDCITLPAFEGLALNNVAITLGANGINGAPCIKNASGKVIGEAWTGAKNAGDTKTWSFSGEHNMVNRLCLSAAPGEEGCALRSIILSYRVAAEKEYIVYDLSTDPATDIDSKSGNATLHASYSASIDEPAKYEAGFEYRIKGAENWTKVSVENPVQSDFNYTLTGIETEHTYEFRAFIKGETDLDITYGNIREFEISNTLVLSLVFGDGTTAKTLYNQWNELWGLKTGNSGVKGPVDKIYSKDGVDYTFTLYADHNVAYRSASSKYWGYCFDYTTVSTDPRYNGWMRLPGVEGMRLSYIEIQLNTKGQFNVSSAVDENNFGNRVYTDNANINQTSTTATHKLNIDSTSAGERVYICSETRNVTVMNLTLKYIPAK